MISPPHRRGGAVACGAVALLLLLVCLLITPAPADAAPNSRRGESLYCGDEDCYAVLGLTRTAKKADIKKAYRKMALEFHPDKNSAEGAEDRFRAASTAYEVLSDDDARKDYDYTLDHPEEVLRNRMRFYRYRYVRQTNPWFVLVTAIVVLTVLHYAYWLASYHWAYRRLSEHPQVLKRLTELMRERHPNDAAAASAATRALVDSVKRGDATAIADVMEVVEVRGFIGRRPTWRDLLVLQLPGLLWRALSGIWWFVRWMVLYRLLRLDPANGTDEDREVHTAALLQMSHSRFCTVLGPEERKALVARKLWIKENMREFMREARHSRK